MDQNNRPLPRTKMNLDIQFKRNYARSQSVGLLKNLSLTGAFLETPQVGELRKNDKIQLAFQVAGRNRKLHATIVWTNSTGMGLKFEHQSNRDMQIVDDLIYFVEASNSEKSEAIQNLFKAVG